MIGGRRGWAAFVCVVAVWLLAAFASAQNALIFIQHDRAGPNLPTADFIYPEWVFWPSGQTGLYNRILSLATGIDLAGNPADATFITAPDGARMSANAANLQARGYFEARKRHLVGIPTYVLTNLEAGVSPSVLLLALSGAETRIVPQSLDRLLNSGDLKSYGLALYEARGWDDAFDVSRKVGGRSLIVEYPPDGEAGWSRFWTRGPWPTGVPTDPALGVPGTIRARDLLTLLLQPERFRWAPTDAGRWGGPNRWFELAHEAGQGVLLLWFLLGTTVLAWALAQVMNEDRGPFVSELLVLLALSPAAIVAAGAIGRVSGPEGWPLWLILTWLLLYALVHLIRIGSRRLDPEPHPLWGVAVLGLATMALCDPLWSLLSGRFGPLDVDVPGVALGAFIGYLTATVALGPGRDLGRAAVAGALVWGVAGKPWWVNGHSAMLVLPAVVWLAAEGLFRPIYLAVLAFLPTGIARIVREGVAWSPNELAVATTAAHSLNLWQSLVLAVSPLSLGVFAFMVAVGLVGNRFLVYRVRKLLRFDPRLRALPWVTLATLCLGVTEPLAFPAVPVLLMGVLLIVAYDGLRSNA